MNKLFCVLCFLLGCLVCLPFRNATNELQELHNKIDKIMVFLLMDLNEDGGGE